ncbi:hypothetical protein NDU88_005440 [Pleurodeles waltl]|uniref:Uncharacterized protein n=1 Tax=Pleurodeles waltl TaxID=8319 RepID=A0AAV7NMF5_PLEWA|nr:hypothetical protein NDU88_005440 [Pleurodeles waltl]
MVLADSTEEKLAEELLETGYSKLDSEPMGKQRIGKDMPAGPPKVYYEVEGRRGRGANATHHGDLGGYAGIQGGLRAQIATLAGEVGLLCDKHKKLKDRAKATENTLGETAPQVKELTQKYALTNNKLRTLAIKVEDAESRCRRHNIRLVGVPEKTKGPSQELFIETWLSSSQWSGHTGSRRPLTKT